MAFLLDRLFVVSAEAWAMFEVGDWAGTGNFGLAGDAS
jgi:hypothetical protein